MARVRAKPASSHNSDPSRPTKMRSSTGCISQARSAVLAAASPISRAARAMRLACGRMNSRAKRTTSVTEYACLSRIAGYLRMGSPPAVLEAGAALGKAAGVYRGGVMPELPMPIPTRLMRDRIREDYPTSAPILVSPTLLYRCGTIPASSNDPCSELRPPSEHIQQHGKTIAQSGLGRKVKLFGRAPRVPDRNPHFSAARRPTMHHELGSTQLRHRLRKTTYGCRFAGADIEHRSLGGWHAHCLTQRTDGILDIGEIAGLFAITENLDRFAAEQPLGKNGDHAGIRGKWILARPVKVKETQADRRDTVDAAGDAGMELAGVFVGAVRAQWRRRTFLVDR